MSEGRGRYSTTPLNGLKHNRGGGFRVPPERPRRGQGNTFVFLQVFMSALLPILFSGDLTLHLFIMLLLIGLLSFYNSFLALTAFCFQFCIELSTRLASS